MAHSRLTRQSDPAALVAIVVAARLGFRRPRARARGETGIAGGARYGECDLVSAPGG